MKKELESLANDGHHSTVGLLIFAGIMAALALFQSKIKYHHILQQLESDTFAAFTPLDCIKVLLFFFIAFSALFVLRHAVSHLNERNSNRKRRSDKQSRKLFFVFFFSSLFFSVIFLLSCYPGTIVSDSMSSIYQSLGLWELNNHHPVFFTFLVTIFMRIGELFEDYNKGIFLFCIIQCALLSLTEAYMIARWFNDGAPLVVCLLTACFYLFNPIFYTYGIMLQKDTLFSLSVFWLILYFDEIERNQGEHIHPGCLFIILFLIAFLRNNGLFVDWVSVAAFCFLYRDTLRPTIKRILFSVLIVFTIIQGPVYKSLNLQGDIKETVGIPLQQVAYVISVNGDISEEEISTFNQILPVEQWAENYHPFIVDPLKNAMPDGTDTFLSTHTDTFLINAFSLALRNPSSFLKAHLLETYGFWSFGSHSGFGFADNYGPLNSGTGIARRDFILNWTGININRFREVHFLDGGSLFWLFLLGLFLCLNSNQNSLHSSVRKKALPFLPPAAVWLSIMIATPTAFSLRYVFILALGLPYFLFRHSF